MSRWDALKPDLKKISSGSNRRVSPRTESKSKQHRMTPAKTTTTNEELLLRYRSLVRSCKSGQDVSLLTRFLTEHTEVIPPEENANAVVGEILLTALDESLGGQSLESNDLTLSTNRTNCDDIFHCISVLLRNAKHCSAMLAPLTDRVSESGLEEKLTNPVRIRLFDLLHKSLTIFPSCVTCFVAALEGTKAVDESSTKSDSDLQLWFIQSYLAHWQEKGDDQNENPWLLVQALVNCRPGVSIALCKCILLRRRRGSNPPCQRCGLSEPPKLLNLIHCNTKNSIVAIRCVTGLLLNLPLQRWLSSSTGTGNVSGHSWTFRDKVVCLLEDVLRLLRCVEYESEDISKLCIVAFNKIPFHYEQHLTSLGAQALDHISFSSTFRKILVECFGGRMTPDGSLTATPLPIQNWLHSNLHFTQQLFDDDTSPSSFTCAVCRSNPSVVLNHRTTWDMYGSAITRLSASNPDPAAELVESLLEGRSNADNAEYAISPKELVQFILPSLDRFLCGNERCQLASCRGFGSLLKCDWEEIASPALHLAQISNLCRGRDLGSKVKSEGYRAIGRICAKLFHIQSLSFGGEEASGTKLTNELLAVLNESDSQVTIRSMSFFAAGNLFQSIHHRGIPAEGIDPSLFLSMISLLQATLTHKEEKVAVNSLRTSGIVCCLLLSDQFWCHRVGFNTLGFVNTVLSSCEEVLSAAVSDTSIESTTWKKRLGAKKKGRAACRCLELIFKSIPVYTHECWSLCCGPVDSLLRTLPQIHLVDRKLAAAILSTLRSIENPRVIESIEPNIAGNSFLDALAGTVLLLLSTATSADLSSMREDLEATLLHLLSLADDNASASVLRRLGRDRSEEFLFWLSSGNVHSTILQRFANAAGSVSLDIQIQLLLVRGIGVKDDGPDEL